MDATSGLKYLTQVELEGYSKEKKESHEWLKENEKGKGMFSFQPQNPLYLPSTN